MIIEDFVLDTDPATGVPGFDPWQGPHRLVADASAR